MFTWDITKAIANFEKHGIPFEEASTIFVDANALDGDDPQHSAQEHRRQRIGRSLSGRILFVVNTIRRRTVKKKPSGSSAQGRRVEKNVKPIPDSKIDFSDIPEATDAELQHMRRAGRPASGMAKQLIAIRLSPKLLSQLRKMAAKQGKPYQSLIHELLEKAAAKAA